MPEWFDAVKVFTTVVFGVLISIILMLLKLFKSKDKQLNEERKENMKTILSFAERTTAALESSNSMAKEIVKQNERKERQDEKLGEKYDTLANAIYEATRIRNN